MTLLLWAWPWVGPLLGSADASELEAAEITELPEPMGLFAGLRYAASNVSGGLIEAGERVSDRRVSRHDLDLAAEFSPVPRFAITGALVLTPSLRYRYPASRTMRLDPRTGSGSYLSGELVGEIPTVRASGIDGAWLGAAVAPRPPGSDRRSAWRLDASVRTPSPRRNLWSAPRGSRGPSSGGAVLRLSGAFSSDQGVFSPWLLGVWTIEGGFRTDIVDEDGTVRATDLKIRPARTFEARTGVALVAVDTEEASVVVDPQLGVGYRSWEDIASGVYLPNVLDTAYGIPITSDDTLFARGLLAVAVHAREVVRIRVGLGLSYTMPYQLEHVYDVRTTGDTLGVEGFVSVTGVGAFAHKQVPRPIEP